MILNKLVSALSRIASYVKKGHDTQNTYFYILASLHVAQTAYLGFDDVPKQSSTVRSVLLNRLHKSFIEISVCLWLSSLSKHAALLYSLAHYGAQWFLNVASFPTPTPFERKSHKAMLERNKLPSFYNYEHFDYLSFLYRTQLRPNGLAGLTS